MSRRSIYFFFGFAAAILITAGLASLLGPLFWCSPKSVWVSNSLICVRAPLHEEPQQVHLSWTDDPSTTLTVSWVTGSNDNPNLVQLRALGTDKWMEFAGEAERLRNGWLASGGHIHRSTMRGLQPDTAYDYRVSSDRGTSKRWSQTFQTRTAPAAGSAFRFAFIADTGLPGRVDGLADGVDAVKRAVLDDDPNFVIGGGDYAYASSDGRFQDTTVAIDQWFRDFEPLLSTMPFMSQFGNHERLLDERLYLWTQRFAHPDGFPDGTSFSFDVGDAHFTGVMADGYNRLDEELLSWIEHDLGQARRNGAAWLIVFQHEPVYGHGRSHPARDEAQKALAPIFQRHKVDLHLSAHDQSYERSFPLEGDPETPEPASEHPDLYEAGAGVIYAKVSPSGKKSEKGRDFSRFELPKPKFIAKRDDSAHHYALVSVEPKRIVVDIYALRDNGGRRRLFDRFEIRKPGYQEPE